MPWLVTFFLKYGVKAYFLGRIAERMRQYITKKYELTLPQDKVDAVIDWSKIEWYKDLSDKVYEDEETIRNHFRMFCRVHVEEIDDVQVVVLIDDELQKCYISIRGTSNVDNVLQDLNFKKDPSARLGISLHTGFHRLSEKITDYVLQIIDKEYSVYLTGHSAGGACAVITGWYLEHSGYQIVDCITFGQPKVTDADGVRKMRGKIKITRVVNETDIVPLVPPAGTHRKRYAHVGNLIILLDQGKFCYLPEPLSMNYGVNSFWLNAANESLSFYELGKEIPDHYLSRYGDNIEKIITDGDEVYWNDRLEYIEDHGIFGEWKEDK